MTLREKMLSEISEIHSGNASEGRAIVSAVIRVMREHVATDEVAEQAYHAEGHHPDSHATEDGIRAALSSIFDEEG